MPLTNVRCDFKPYRDTELLRSIKTLETINDKPAAEFWKEVEEKQAAFEAWTKQVAGMPAEKQVEAVAKKLQELNPGFDGKVTPTDRGRRGDRIAVPDRQRDGHFAGAGVGGLKCHIWIVAGSAPERSGRLVPTLSPLEGDAADGSCHG